MAEPVLSNYSDYRLQKSSLVPSTYSRDSWFNHCMARLATRLTQLVKDDETDEKAALQVFEIVEDLLLDVDQRSKNATQLPELLDVFPALIPLVESKSLPARKRAQSIFSSLLDCHHYDCQFTILRQVFKAVAAQEINAQMQPQVLAWLMDMYRKKLILPIEEESCHQIFRVGLSTLYDQISLLVYEDMASSAPFYVAAMLLLEEHALHSFDLELLKKAKGQLLEKFQTQLAECIHLKEMLMKKEGNSKSRNPILEQEVFSLELLKFTVTEARRRIDKALSSQRLVKSAA